MEIMETTLPEVKVVMPRRIGDVRGFFSEVWNAREFASIGIAVNFVQDNHVRNPQKGTLRGLHFQVPPAAQGKLVRVTRGAIFDVAVDIRRGSPSFGRHAAAVLTADNWYQLWIPPGFAHGYCTLEADTEVQYKTTDFYSPAHDRGIVWFDPVLMITWPVTVETAVFSERDRALPRLAEQTDLFEYPCTSEAKTRSPGPRAASALSGKP
jgi:dTDP-4-dehydrorhamnose 3,5-epimerase